MKHLSPKESETVEFKAAFDREAIKTLTAFANAKVGSVYVGINDKRKVVGVQIGCETIRKWINQIKLSTAPSNVKEVYEA